MAIIAITASAVVRTLINGLLSRMMFIFDILYRMNGILSPDGLIFPNLLITVD